MRATMIAPVDERAFSNGLARIGKHSPFLAGLVQRHPETVAAVHDHGLAEAIRQGLAAAACEDVGRMLRRQRQIISLATALADLTGMASLEEVVEQLSAFADHALDLAIRTAIVERAPDEIGRAHV
jgi:glutamate-ammonia-ligase adenylyltransferase